MVLEDFCLIPTSEKWGQCHTPMTSLGLHGVNTTTKSNVSFLVVAKGSAVTSVSSVVSDRGSSEEDDAKYSSLVSSYQDKSLAGEDTESVENQLNVDGLFPRTLQVRYENTVTMNSW